MPKRKFARTSRNCVRSAHLNDPKFQLQPIVHLERYDFSNYLLKNDLQRPVVHLKQPSFSSSLGENNKTAHVKDSKQKNISNLILNNDKQKESTDLEGKNSSKLSHNTQRVVLSDKCIKDNKLDEGRNMQETHILRKRKLVNYEERQYSLTPVLNKTAVPVQGRIPIYRTLNTVQEPSKTKRDQYAFIPESDEDKDSDNSFQIKTPVKKRKIVYRNKIKGKQTHTSPNKHIEKRNVNKINQYEDKINQVMKELSNKIKSRKDHPTERGLQSNLTSSQNDEMGNAVKSPINSVPGFESQNISFQRNPQVDSDIINLGLNNAESARDKIFNSLMCNVNNVNVQSFSRSHSPNSVPCISSASPCISKEIANEDNTFDDCSSNSMDVVSSPCNLSKSEDQDDALFGFCEDLDDNEEKIRNCRVNIIQDVTLTESSCAETEPSSQKQRQSRKSWRFHNNYVTRNPHFLDIKKNALPSLNQDAILDHTFADHIDEVNHTVLKPTESNLLRQQSILNYIESDKDHFGDIQQNTSLYDADQYSPIKLRNTDKENAVKVNRQLRRGKRNILGELGENVMQNQTSTPARNKPSAPMSIDFSSIEDTESKENSDKCFGFETSSECVEEPENLEDKNVGAKPFRLNVYSKKICKPKEISEKLSRPVRDSEVRRLVNDEPEFQKLVEDLECHHNNLFEDVESPQRFQYKPMKRRVYELNDVKKKKKEEKLSKDAQKWIKEFNKMCNEVEDFELEVD